MATEDTSTPNMPDPDQAAVQVTAVADVAPATNGDSTKVAAGNDGVRNDQNDKYSLSVKKEYVLTERAASLPPLEPPKEVVVEESGGGDDRGNNSKRGKKAKQKKRPRDARIEAGDKICLAIMRGKTCPFGDTCRFSHDIKEYIATRTPDIVSESGEGGCHIYNKFGYCIYGAMCRFGASHVNMATGANIRKDPESEGVPPPMNVLSKDVQVQLRKNKFPFKTKRRQDMNKKDDKPAPEVKDLKPDAASVSVDAMTGAPTKGAVMDLSPLPSTRKIVDFSNKVYVAPLTTVGNLPFRRVMKRFGADITCGEMALASNLLSGQPSEWALLKRHPDEDIFGVQICAAYPDMYTRAAEVIEETMTIDFMDMNLGCPLDLVCSKGAGSALMMREKRLMQSVEGILNTISCPVTIKIRTGWDMNNPFAHELVPKIQGWGFDGIATVMIHGRSRLQRYSKEADWKYISRVAASQDPSKPIIPIIGNGDIFSYTDYEEKVTQEGISSCAMIGRGALIKPWLPTEIKERRHWDISASERLDILKDFVKFGMEHWGSDQQVCFVFVALCRLNLQYVCRSLDLTIYSILFRVLIISEDTCSSGCPFSIATFPLAYWRSCRSR
jgi:tRNA-dihydrouridine synthase 3